MDTPITIFLGIYNGSSYIDSLRTQLKNQTQKNFNLVVVDNCSEDDSWSQLQVWKQDFPGAITLHRNEQNLGGGGSLDNALKKGLIRTTWFAMMHQDDYYLPNHVETIQNEITTCNESVVGICTLMGSMGNDGSNRITPPRAAWLINDNSQLDSFLVNLRLQAFSFPTAAVKTKTFIESFAHWHSPSFSDTETTLNLLTKGELTYIKKETIKYRENPDSESHVVNSLESTVGACLGLTRVLTSQGFRDLLGTVPENQRAQFFLALKSGIEIRVPNSSMSNHLKILAAEECCYVWGYSELESNKFLSTIYASLGSKFTSRMLANKSQIELPSGDGELEDTLRSYSNQLGLATFGRSTINSKQNRLARITSKLPLRVKIVLFKIYVRIRAIKQPDYYWNVFWK